MLLPPQAIKDTIGTTGYLNMDDITSNSVVSMLNFLSVRTVLWSYRRMSLFIVKCHDSDGLVGSWGGVACWLHTHRRERWGCQEEGMGVLTQWNPDEEDEVLIWLSDSTPGYTSGKKKNKNTNLKRYMHPSDHSSITYNCQHVEATRCGTYIHHELWEGSLGEDGYMYMYGWVPSQFTWNYHNAVNWLYPNTK